MVHILRIFMPIPLNNSYHILNMQAVSGFPYYPEISMVTDNFHPD